MEKNAAFQAGIIDALQKHAEFGKAPVEGATQTIAGVTKVFKGGKWVSPSQPSTLQSVAKGVRGFFAKKPAAAPTAPIVRRVNVARARRLAGALA